MAAISARTMCGFLSNHARRRDKPGKSEGYKLTLSKAQYAPRRNFDCNLLQSKHIFHKQKSAHEICGLGELVEKAGGGGLDGNFNGIETDWKTNGKRSQIMLCRSIEQVSAVMV